LSFNNFEDLKDHATITDDLYKGIRWAKDKYDSMKHSDRGIAYEDNNIQKIEELFRKLSNNSKKALELIVENDLGEYSTFCERCSKEAEKLNVLLSGKQFSNINTKEVSVKIAEIGKNFMALADVR